MFNLLLLRISSEEFLYFGAQTLLFLNLSAKFLLIQLIKVFFLSKYFGVKFSFIHNRI